eukprot:1145687-Pelagomonas_calceolata.AAC.4
MHDREAYLYVAGPACHTDFFYQLRNDAKFDQEYTSVLTSAQEGKHRNFTEKDGLLWCTSCPEATPGVCILHGQACELLNKEAHDTPTSGHLGICKTHEALHRTYFLLATHVPYCLSM